MKSNTEFKLANAPIVEAVLDIDCDMPAGPQFAALEISGKAAFKNEYPKFRPALVHIQRFEAKAEQSPQISIQNAIQAFQFLHDDERQIVQVRTQGFSFNRLAPYTNLDDYLPQIEHAWQLFIAIASPVQIRTVRLRYINRIMLPLDATGNVELNHFIKMGPRLPDEKRFTLQGFLEQQMAVEIGTGNQVNVVLTGQPRENDWAPVIFDITAEAAIKAEPEDWACILEVIHSLRSLKNHIFRNTLTERCLNLFQLP